MTSIHPSIHPFTYALSLAERGQGGLVNVIVLYECQKKRLDASTSSVDMWIKRVITTRWDSEEGNPPVRQCWPDVDVQHAVYHM